MLQAYAQGGYLSESRTWNRATLAVIASNPPLAADGANDPANQVLIAVAQEFTTSAATLVSQARSRAPPRRAARSPCCATAAW